LKGNRGVKMNQRKIFNAVLAGLICFASMLFVFKALGACTPTPQHVETLQAGMTLSPGYLQKARPGHTVDYTHTLVNTGTATGTFSLTVASSLNWTVALFDESHPSMELLPVQLGAGMTATIGVSVTAPTLAFSGTVAHTTITATLSTTPTVQAIVTDVTRVYRELGVILSPGQSKEGTAGSIVTFTHTITNTGPITDAFVVEAKSQQDWPVELLEGTDLTATLQTPLWLGELGSSDFVVSMTVPGNISDTVEQIAVTATSLVSDSVMSAVTDTIIARETHAYTAFLPLLVQGFGFPHVKLGVDFGCWWTWQPGTVEYDYPLTKDMGADWMRIFLPWLEIETAPGEYDWDRYDVVFDRLRELEFNVIVVVYGPPEWAAEEICGPISDTLALENFLDLAVPRYADVTDAWEFINEPDGKALEPDYGAAGGCWGLYPAEYARQLPIFFSKIRTLDPDALVFFGGLAYDAWHRFERSFFEEALQNGAGSFFDGMSLHYYPINPVEFPTMDHKINEIRDTMSRNGVHDKLIWLTETSMWTNMGHGLEAQLDYIVKEQSRGFGAGVDNIFWFAVGQEGEEPRLNRWLIDIDHEPDNGYYTYQHFAAKIEGLYCLGAYQDVPEGVEAYEFAGEDRSLYILWSDAVTSTVSIPASTDAFLTDRDGGEPTILPVQMGAVEFEVGPRPIFVEFMTEN
jgi:hypothetical protein